ncbi:hypothetical protein BURK2_03132 [Burkholderiales bacterium]|nr:hypothetical protein BURK2_03132 [Burkholderiales bacterium]
MERDSGTIDERHPHAEKQTGISLHLAVPRDQSAAEPGRRLDMSGEPEVVESVDAIPTALVRAELERVVNGQSFRQCLQQQRLLRFLVESALSHRAAPLKETTLAIDCLGRDAGRFDPRKDPIVRVTARRIRERLAHYYQDEGADAYLEFSIPVGSYAPRVAWREPREPRRANQRFVAVLPVRNATGDLGAEPFCQALGDAVIEALAGAPGCKVVARTSADRFKDHAADNRVIGATLGVGAVFRGTVTQEAGRMQISARLEAARDGALVWSGSYAEVPGAPFGMQAKLVNDLVQFLVTRLATTAPSPPLQDLAALEGATHSAEAKDCHDRARFALRQQSIEGYRKAIELFSRALRIDPAFAAAHSGLALAHLGVIAWTAASSETVGIAKQAALRALEIAPQMSEACSALASILFRFEYDWSAAEPMYRRAIQLAPGARYAHQSYAYALMFRRAFDFAEREFLLARELDPLDQSLRCHLALLTLYTGRYQAAEAEFLAITDVDPRNLLARTLLAFTYLCLQRPDEALVHYQWASEFAPELSIGWCGRAQALAMQQRHDESKALLDAMLKTFAGKYVSPYQVAMVHARLDDQAAALHWLERAAKEHDANLICAPVDPTFEKLRQTPQWGSWAQTSGAFH